MRMKIVSLNVGLPREVTWHGMNVVTGIFKQPVEGRVALRKLNLYGDRQAVYCYPLSHYDFWKHELPRTGSGAAFLADFARSGDLPMGMFGENFTIDVREGDSESNEDACAPFLPGSGRSGEPVGTPFLAALARTGDLPEDSIHIGDRFSVGSAEVVVTQP